MQLSMFAGTTTFKIDKPIRLIELFGGISCQAQALTNLGIDFENYRYCDFDKYACQSHNEIIGTNDKPSDITKWKGEDLGICDTDEYCYIMTYSFPCTDLSTAGKMAGMERNSGTRSGLLWEVERLLKECNQLPQVLLMENVPQVHGKKNKTSFDEWCQFLESLGYKNYWKDLNAKDYGVPQNRKRCFMVSLLGDYSYEFPEPIELKLKLQDLLEDDVDEKYYLSDKALTGIDNTKFNSGKLDSRLPKDGVCPTLLARDYKDPKLVQVAQLKGKGFTEMTGRVYDSKGLCPTIQTMQGGNRQPKIIVASKNKRLQSLINKINLKDETLALDCYNQTAHKNIIQTIKTNIDTSNMTMVYTDYRIRKLTPIECLRLMGVRDEYSKRMTCSNAQKYKQAGNGIVVDVLMAIFKQML